MMRHPSKSEMLAALVLFASSSLACAQANAWDGPKSQSYKGVPYISGGVGLEERAALRAHTANDNLQLSFALRDKEYLGGAKVMIKDDKGQVILEAVSDGPLFYARLPQGDYRVMATANDETLSRNVRIPDKGKVAVYFAWQGKNQRLAFSGHELPVVKR